MIAFQAHGSEALTLRKTIEYRLLLQTFKGFNIHAKTRAIPNRLGFSPLTFFLNKKENLTSSL